MVKWWLDCFDSLVSLGGSGMMKRKPLFYQCGGPFGCLDMKQLLGAFLTSLLKLLKSCVICKSIPQFGGKQEAKFEKFSCKAEFVLVPKKREHIQFYYM